MASRFFLVGNSSSRRKSSSATPKRHSLPELNRRISEESNASLQRHTFFGPPSQTADKTREIHDVRSIHMNKTKVWLYSQPIHVDLSGKSVLGEISGGASKGGFTSQLFAFGQRMKNLTQKAVVNEDSFCDGCAMDPIIGDMWTCTECENYNLCDGCYRNGVHGFESSAILTKLRQDFAVSNMVDFCRNRVPEEVFSLLMTKVCKGQVDKFNFLANWIAGVVLGNSIASLSVRGIEIPSLNTETRGTLVHLLTPVLAERSDIEVSMEWFTPDDDSKTTTTTPPDTEKVEELTTLRIWVNSDKDLEKASMVSSPAKSSSESGLNSIISDHLSPLSSPTSSSGSGSDVRVNSSSSSGVPSSPEADDDDGDDNTLALVSPVVGLPTTMTPESDDAADDLSPAGVVPTTPLQSPSPESSPKKQLESLAIGKEITSSSPIMSSPNAPMTPV